MKQDNNYFKFIKFCSSIDYKLACELFGKYRGPVIIKSFIEPCFDTLYNWLIYRLTEQEFEILVNYFENNLDKY